MHKIFGVKCEVSYVDRKGAYISVNIAIKSL